MNDCDYISVLSQVESDSIDDWPRCLATNLSARPGNYRLDTPNALLPDVVVTPKAPTPTPSVVAHSRQEFPQCPGTFSFWAP